MYSQPTSVCPHFNVSLPTLFAFTSKSDQISLLKWGFVLPSSPPLLALLLSFLSTLILYLWLY